MTKRQVLEILETNRGKSVSGESIAAQLHVSRNMIWRAINSLRAQGYMIEAGTNRGYCLTGENDMISVEGIKPYLLAPAIAKDITVYSRIDSTNREAKLRAIAEASHGTVIIADAQSNGRGRYGREFISPTGKGIYMSIVLEAGKLPDIKPTAVTALAAVCVCEVLEQCLDIAPKIKWVNDIYIDGKKVAGILTEAITDLESGNIERIILGIGINVTAKPIDFPPALRETATSLFPGGKGDISRNHLIAQVLNRILCQNLPNGTELFTKYRARVLMLGQSITVMAAGGNYEAIARDIDKDGHLIIELPNGKMRALSGGEISVRQ